MKILAIDDDASVLKALEILFCFGSDRCACASSGEEGLRRAQAEPFDLILSDIHMPGLSGLELCAQLKADPKTHDIPVVLMSGTGEEDILVQALRSGAADFLPKPFDVGEIRRVVKRAIEREGMAEVPISY
jgi:CheY-like chemotaxis protein